jgi:carboxypeptidase Q
MKTTRHLLWLWMALAGLGGPVVAGATGDGDSAAMLGCILEGMQRSQVVDLAQHLSDDIGARLTNYPGMRQAESWSEAQFRQWGLTAVRRDPFEFGRGWTAVEWGRFLDTVS